jgi:hypothetical protein
MRVTVVSLIPPAARAGDAADGHQDDQDPVNGAGVANGQRQPNRAAIDGLGGGRADPSPASRCRH